MKQAQKRPNSLGISGWAYAGGYRVERYLYFAHRLTGLSLLLLFLIYLVRITFIQIQGQDTWSATLLIVHSRWFGIIAALFVFHALNGLRLSLQETGLLLGRASPPAYPYVDALRRNRLLTTVTLTAALLLILLILLILFIFFISGVL